MPAIVGGAKVISVNIGGLFNVGDAAEISPKYVAKSMIGSGSSNTGDLATAINMISVTDTLDIDVNDQTITSAL